MPAAIGCPSGVSNSIIIPTDVSGVMTHVAFVFVLDPCLSNCDFTVSEVGKLRCFVYAFTVLFYDYFPLFCVFVVYFPCDAD